MQKADFLKKNMILFSKALQNRRKLGNLPFNEESWAMYVDRIKTRFEVIKLEAIRSRNLAPEDMLLNFLDLERSLTKLKNAVENAHDRT